MGSLLGGGGAAPIAFRGVPIAVTQIAAFDRGEARRQCAGKHGDDEPGSRQLGGPCFATFRSYQRPFDEFPPPSGDPVAAGPFGFKVGWDTRRPPFKGSPG